MGALGEQYPKALLPIGNEPVIVHHLRLLESLGVRDVYVIVGHRACHRRRQRVRRSRRVH
jgi:NDP-sugar pyrophosphorylase family protein